MKTSRCAAIGAGLLALAACKGQSSAGAKAETASSSRVAQRASDTFVVAAATYPVAWLGCQLVGDPCRLVALVPPGASAHTWEPRPSDLQTLRDASLFVRAGLAFEDAWVPRLRQSVGDLEVVDARAALDLREDEHEHEHGHKHGAEEGDPHVWSSPRAMARLADTLAVRLVEARPDLRGRIGIRKTLLHARLLALDSAARVLFAPFSGRTFLVNHPGLGYLARDYGFIQKPLESHGQELTPVMLWEIRKIARAQGVRAVFVQIEASRRVADQIARELGVGTVDLELLAPVPYDSLFLSTARRMAEKL